MVRLSASDKEEVNNAMLVSPAAVDLCSPDKYFLISRYYTNVGHPNDQEA